MTIFVVTGTDTGVGKTITTAALATCWPDVAVYKPVQAGTEDGLGDIDVVRRLSGATVAEGIRLRDPMAPGVAAARSGVRLPRLSVHQEAVRRLAASHDHVLVEGAGGLLVALDEDGHTIADLARALSAAAIVVCRAGLGTLNHTALTLEALAGRQVAVTGLIIGCWPEPPTDVELDNREQLATTAPLLGAIPDGAGQLPGERFRLLAPRWLGPGAPGEVPSRAPSAQLSRSRSPRDRPRRESAGTR